MAQFGMQEKVVTHPPGYPGAPQPNGIIRDARDYPNDWSTDLCDFWGNPDCCYACFCPLCYHCKVGYKFGDGCCTALYCAPLMLYRAVYRHKKQIRGHHCKDCMASVLCAPCVSVQIMEEHDKRGSIFQ